MVKKKKGKSHTQTFETFRQIGNWELDQLKKDKPSAFNGMVCVRKYRVTVEEIDEPPEIIGQRIQDLWDACDNHYHWTPLEAAAKKVGWELKGQAGSKRKDRK